jgi:uncharacterized protein YdcH (DUF465 family)
LKVLAAGEKEGRMETQDHDLVERLLKEDEAFRDKYRSHRDYENKIARLDKKAHLSGEETVEKNRLKKLKLALKDEMERMLAVRRAGRT